jgi:nicotinamidase-related amidase
MLSKDTCALVVIDVQGKLARLMYDKDELLENSVKLVKGARALGVPVVWTEQLPDKIGGTLPALKAELEGLAPIVKKHFSCCGEPAFHRELQRVNRKQVLVAGIEAHICVYQTILDLLNFGYEVHAVADAISSRVQRNYDIAMRRIWEEGARVTCVEMVLFELLKVAEGEKFKQILKVIK